MAALRLSPAFAASLRPASLGRFGSSRQALAALEFAFIAPVLVLTMFAAYDVAQALIALNRLTNAANAVAQIGTELAATATGTNTLSGAQANTATSAIYAFMPELSGAAPPVFGVVLSSIAMAKDLPACRLNCTYSPHVAWSAALQGTNGVVRPCDVVLGVPVLVAGADTQDPSPGTLPATLFSPQPILVTDLTYVFQPLFAPFSWTGPGGTFTLSMPSYTMSRSTYFTLRNVAITEWARYSGIPVPEIRCPGYHS